MSKINKMDRNQMILTTFCLDDLVDENNPVRGIDVFVNYLDLKSLGFKEFSTGKKGQQPYNRAELLKLHIYGYLNGVKSSRKLEKECHRNIELMWLTNCITPDHGTISAFIKDNRKAFKRVMQKLTLDLKSFGLVDLSLFTVDGTKIRAQNSKNNTISLTTIEKKMEYVNEQIEKYVSFMTEESSETTKIEEKLSHYNELKAKYEQQKQILIDEKLETKALHDEDSRKMKNHGTLEMCYNVQSVVESKNHFILEIDTTNDINDENQLYDMTLKTRDLLCNEHDEITVMADTGYYNCLEIKKCIDEKIKVIIKKSKANNSTKESMFKKDRFIYDKEKDVYICPNDKNLGFFENSLKNGLKYRRYKCSDCLSCPFKEKCTTSKTGRTIQRWEYESILEDVHSFTLENEDIYRKRRNIVEHPFGYFKRALHFTYFNRKGLNNVDAETQLMGIAYNLRRLFTMFPKVQDLEKVFSIK